MKLKQIVLLLNIPTFLLFFITTTNAQTYTIKIVPNDEYSELFKIDNSGNMVVSSTIKEKERGRHFKNRMIYISDNASYYTLIPSLGYGADSLLYSYPNVPVFTYLKDFEVIVEKLEDSTTKVHSKKEFNDRFGYETTNEFKNYHGTRVQKYASKGNFYEMYFWVAEGDASESNNDFITILKTLGLVSLEPNTKIVAINYLGSEFPINFIQLSHKSRQNLNRELFEDIKVSLKTEEPQETYTSIANSADIKHLLNKAITFNYKRTNSGIDFNFKSNSWESDTYLNNNNTNRIQFFEGKFYAFIDDFLLQGRVDDNGDLIYESSKRRIKKLKNHTMDLSDHKLLYLNKNNDSLDFCVQDLNKFWSFTRYTLVTKTKDFKHLSVDLILPNGKTYKGLIKNAFTFNASYKDSRYEYSTFSGDIEQLDTTHTYVIKE
ncbi:hypothetical protein [uncultured Winogradskyella sp.]|uniref:hypothetical protein n=1 Tax=uncultured Winogradskyella sp. TaxID=395353 RepID=UPI0026116283|nr:hypothetical protein [uncultured Winogradskyella sp.]